MHSRPRASLATPNSGSHGLVSRSSAIARQGKRGAACHRAGCPRTGCQPDLVARLAASGMACMRVTFSRTASRRMAVRRTAWHRLDAGMARRRLACQPMACQPTGCRLALESCPASLLDVSPVARNIRIQGSASLDTVSLGWVSCRSMASVPRCRSASRRRVTACLTGKTGACRMAVPVNWPS